LIQRKPPDVKAVTMVGLHVSHSRAICRRQRLSMLTGTRELLRAHG
jgi:hypothetical protein